MSTTPRPDVHSPATALPADPPPSRKRSTSPRTPADNFSLTPAIATSAALALPAVDRVAADGEEGAVVAVVAAAAATSTATASRTATTSCSGQQTDNASCSRHQTDNASCSRHQTATTSHGRYRTANACSCRQQSRSDALLDVMATVQRSGAAQAPVSGEEFFSLVTSRSPAASETAPQAPAVEEEEEQIAPIAGSAADPSSVDVPAEAAATVAADEAASPQLAAASEAEEAEAQRLRTENHAAIMKVNADPALTMEEKTSRMQALHLKRSLALQERVQADATKRNRSIELSYHNRDTGVWGCKHYARKCIVKFVCCNEWHTCRLCHDEASDHECNRKLVQEVKCMSCSMEQPVARQCRNCQTVFARYFCEICRLYDDTPDKPLYHCEKCGICRVGLNNYHCDNCNACVVSGLNKNPHRCVRNALDQHCPCCRRYLWDSTERVVFIKCGHAMHAACLDKYSETSYTCPLCHKELGEMQNLYKTYDDEIAQQPMPEEFAHWMATIKCFECAIQSDVPFHLSYRHRCKSCTSYNTRVVKTYPGPTGGATVESAQISSVSAAPARREGQGESGESDGP